MRKSRNDKPVKHEKLKKSRSRGWGYLETFLIGVGIVCAGVYVSACAQKSIVQKTESRSFERELSSLIQTEKPNQSEWSTVRIERFAEMQPDPERTHSALGRLVISKADVEVMVLDGTSDETLDRGVGLIEGTARPDEGGNIGIAGHRDSFFRGLRHLSPGDEIEFATLKGLTRYRVSEILVVEPEYVQVLDPTPESSLTLVTCYPFYHIGSAPQRFIVRAEETAFEEWTPLRVARFSADSPATP
jgi:sortase A